MNIFTVSVLGRQLRVFDIDPRGPGQIKNNEIQHLCQVEMSAGSEGGLSPWKRGKDGEPDSDAHLSKLFLQSLD